jgi:hypothetical protein
MTINTDPLAEFLRDARRAGRLNAWKQVTDELWTLDRPGYPCRGPNGPYWTRDEVVRWLAQVGF